MAKSTLPTPYPDLNQVLTQLVEGVKEILNQKFYGAYLQGSFALGDFDEHSDVDFLMIYQDDLSSEELTKLQGFHRQIYQLESPWAQHLEGTYFPLASIRESPVYSEQFWYLDNGHQQLEKSSHCNTLVVRWTLRNKGVVLEGPTPENFIKGIGKAELRQEIYNKLQRWGQHILSQPQYYNNRFYQGFIVLSYCRMLHDLKAGQLSSKKVSAQWAKEQFGSEWHDLIDNSWQGRIKPEKSVQEKADPRAFQRSLQFVQFISQESKVWMENMIR